jgi:hypothetical protein
LPAAGCHILRFTKQMRRQFKGRFQRVISLLSTQKWRNLQGGSGGRAEGRRSRVERGVEGRGSRVECRLWAVGGGRWAVGGGRWAVSGQRSVVSGQRLAGKAPNPVSSIKLASIGVHSRFLRFRPDGGISPSGLRFQVSGFPRPSSLVTRHSSVFGRLGMGWGIEGKALPTRFQE